MEVEGEGEEGLLDTEGELSDSLYVGLWVARKFPLVNVGLSLDKLLPWNWDACAGEGKV